MKLHFRLYKMRLRHVFRTAAVERHTQDTLIVAWEEDGVCGYGECSENSFYGSHVLSFAGLLKERCQKLEQAAEGQAAEAFYDHYLANSDMHAFLCCALDTALHDLRARQAGASLRAHWGLAKQKQPPISSYTLGIDTTERMIEKMKECPWPIYKVKLGTGNDLALMEALRAESTSCFRVDVNGGWELSEAIEKSKALTAMGGVEFIEQPMAADVGAEAERKLYKESGLPIVADERVLGLQDLDSMSGRFHGINVKLTKCGGLTPTRRLLEAARGRGLRCMAGCMVESSVGISALAQLLPLLDDVDMDGALLVANDPASGVVPTSTGVRYPAENGTGVRLHEEL